MELIKAREKAVKQLQEAHIQSSVAEVDQIISHVLHVNLWDIQKLIAIDTLITKCDSKTIESLISRRSQHEPLQYILGFAFFRKIQLQVGHGVFIPRPETEITTQVAIDFLIKKRLKNLKIADLGTGSGAIALSIAFELAQVYVFAIENSAEAFCWAQTNFENYKRNNLKLIFGNLVNALASQNGKLDMVISNPPYLATNQKILHPEVYNYDPICALYAGLTGLEIIKKVIKVAARLLKHNGILVVEHGEDQADSVVDFLHNGFWETIKSHNDLTGRKRVVTAQIKYK